MWTTREVFSQVDTFDFCDCPNCDSIAIDGEAMPRLDEMAASRSYNEEYWAFEARDSWGRSFGQGLARASEAILCARPTISRFLDIGAGPGYLLDALSTYLPKSREKFWSVDLFPPPRRTSRENYVGGTVENLQGPYQAGVCIEVVEHLTPAMVRSLVSSLAAVSEPGSSYLFNT